MQQLFSALGIDWRSLLLDGAAFILLVLAAERWIYPVLVKALDEKRRQLETIDELESAAKNKLQDAQESSLKILSDAYAEAHKIVTEAGAEAAEAMKTARDKADLQAKRILLEGHRQLSRDVEQARLHLKQDTAELVASAAGKVLGAKLGSAEDEQLIERSLREAGR